MGTRLTQYVIQLGKREEVVNGSSKILWHITSPDVENGRIDTDSWKKFLKVIRNNFPHRLNWELYAKPEGTQPVYEYTCNLDDLKYVINDYITRTLNGHAIIKEFLYSKEEHFFDIHPEIANSYDFSYSQPYI